MTTAPTTLTHSLAEVIEYIEGLLSAERRRQGIPDPPRGRRLTDQHAAGFTLTGGSA